MNDRATRKGSRVQSIAQEREREVLPKNPIGHRDQDFQEPGAFGEEVAEKMLAIARQYFPPAKSEKQE